MRMCPHPLLHIERGPIRRSEGGYIIPLSVRYRWWVKALMAVPYFGRRTLYVIAHRRGVLS